MNTENNNLKPYEPINFTYYVPAIEKINFKRFRVATKANNGEL